MEETTGLNNDEALDPGIENTEEAASLALSAEIPEAESERKRRLTVKVPVVLAEPTLQFDLDTTIYLPAPALEIKRVQKRLKLTQCLILQDTNKLSVKGFVRKNIEFATVATATPTTVSGAIQHFTVDIPFGTIVEIIFDQAPIVPVIENTVSNFEFLRQTGLPVTFPEKDRLESGDLTEFNQVSTEYFNELPFCELVSSTIIEYDEYLNRAPIIEGPFEESTFTAIEEKVVITLTLKILQKQQVVLPPPKPPKPPDPPKPPKPCHEHKPSFSDSQAQEEPGEKDVEEDAEEPGTTAGTSSLPVKITK
jgi:hypothetical protein